MREIKFRGIDKDSGEFVYGGIAREVLTASGFIADVAIMPPRCYGIEVNPETVGQYTGLKDCDGVEIYEGDLIQLLKPKSKDFATVDFINAYVGGWVLTHKDTDNVLSLGARNSNELKVVGNIHQNPDLLPTQPANR